MLERGKMDRDVVEIVGIDSLVPKEHLLLLSLVPGVHLAG